MAILSQKTPGNVLENNISFAMGTITWPLKQFIIINCAQIAQRILERICVAGDDVFCSNL